MTDDVQRKVPRWVEILELSVPGAGRYRDGVERVPSDDLGRQAQPYGQASSTRFEANAASTFGGQQLIANASIFTAWLEAHDAGDRPLENQLERRFTPEYAKAFQEWLTTDPFSDPDAPPGPAAMPSYANPGLGKAAQLNAQASGDFATGTEARETANKYARDTVLLATVIFFVVTAQRFTRHGIHLAANGIALALLLYTLLTLVALPRA